jgi:ubiquitin carboxyl-terminal hydrolase 2/21
MNSVIQCIIRAPEFIDLLASQNLSDLRSPNILNDLILLATDQNARANDRLKNIKKICASLNPEFGGYEQADAHEFLRTALFSLHQGVNRRPAKVPYEQLDDEPGESAEQASKRWLSYHKKRDDSVVYDLFGGILQSTVKCLACGNLSFAFDPTLDLSLALPKTTAGETSQPAAHSTTIETLLEMFEQKESLKGDNLFNCKKCRKAQEAIRATNLLKLPKCLVIHLKRFNSRGLKNSMPVGFSRRTSLINSSGSQTMRYDLFGVICHRGSSSSGHYTSYVRVADGSWFLCNDGIVMEVDLQTVLEQQSTAFILFYGSTN